MSKKKHKLDFTPELEFDLIGISSHENDYRLSWAINNSLGFKFIKTDNLKVADSKNSNAQFFSKYTYSDEETMAIYHLISNRCDNGFLLEEYKNIDFLMMIQGEFDNYYLSNIVNSIKNIDLVTLTFQIDLNALKVKSKIKLIF